MFERLIIEALAALPLRVREAMKNIAIVIEQEPRRGKSGEVGIKRHETLLGLYQGIPLIERDSGYSGVLPDKITIFQKPIETLGGKSEENLKVLVAEVVWHEIGHHFGLSDLELDLLISSPKQGKKEERSEQQDERGAGRKIEVLRK